jgi:hypothetical protein
MIFLLPTQQERVKNQVSKRIHAGLVCLVVIKQIIKHIEDVRKNSKEYGVLN